MSLQLLICGTLCFHSFLLLWVYGRRFKGGLLSLPNKINNICPSLGAVLRTGEAKGFSLRERVLRKNRA